MKRIAVILVLATAALPAFAGVVYQVETTEANGTTHDSTLSVEGQFIKMEGTAGDEQFDVGEGSRLIRRLPGAEQVALDEPHLVSLDDPVRHLVPDAEPGITRRLLLGGRCVAGGEQHGERCSQKHRNGTRIAIHGSLP